MHIRANILDRRCFATTGKSVGLFSTIAGGAETFYGKNKEKI